MIANPKVWLAVFLVAGALPLVPPAHAGSCEETDSGYGWEYPECSFSCGVKQGLHAAIDGGDSNDDVSATANCGGAIAQCSDDDGACGASSPTVTVRSETGTCKGSGYDGSVYWISVTVSCYSYDRYTRTDDVELIASTLGSKHLASVVQVLPELGVTSIARIVVTEGIAVGTLCTQAGPGLLECHAAPVRESVGPDGMRTFAL